MIITTSALVQLCSKLAALSSNQANLTTVDFLTFGNLVVMSLTSELLAAREEFLISSTSVPVTAGNASYRIPPRAVNGTVRHLWFENATGGRTRLYPSSVEDIENYQTTSTGTPRGFYVFGNSIVLVPTPSVAGALVMAFPFRPNQLVDQATTTSISGIVGNVATVANVPANFASGSLFDVIDHQSGNGIVYWDQPAAILGNQMTFTNLTDLNLAGAGNYVAQAGQAPVPMLPEEGHSLLTEMVVMRVEMVRGNTNRIKNSGALIQDARKAFDALLANRIVSKAHVAGGMSPLMPGGFRPW